jgi:NAD(P)-dependent dehydrogenase (short-subunit alcohol dehydrogenase family)
LATNHLGHFLLATGLYSALRASGNARVVSLSSSAHLYCPVLFDDPAFAFVPYSPFLGDGQSKTANVLFAVEANRRWGRDAITVNSVMPGGIATRLQRHIDPEALAQARR